MLKQHITWKAAWGWIWRVYPNKKYWNIYFHLNILYLKELTLPSRVCITGREKFGQFCFGFGASCFVHWKKAWFLLHCSIVQTRICHLSCLEIHGMAGIRTRTHIYRACHKSWWARSPPRRRVTRRPTFILGRLSGLACLRLWAPTAPELMVLQAI